MNNYIPKIIPLPEIKKEPCLTPACMEINKKMDMLMKQLQPLQVSNSKTLQTTSNSQSK